MHTPVPPKAHSIFHAPRVDPAHSSHFRATSRVQVTSELSGARDGARRTYGLTDSTPIVRDRGSDDLIGLRP